MGAFLQPDSHPVIYFITWEMLKFPHQLPRALENVAKSIELKEPGKLVPILSPKYGYFFHQIPILCYLLLHGKCIAFFHQFPVASIPDTLELKVKYIKRRRGHGYNFIKKEEYKYTLGKSIPPYTKLS